MSDKFRIGRVAKSTGIKGEITVEPDTYDINRYYDLTKVYVGSRETDVTPMKIESVRIHKDRPVIKFADIETRDDADKMAGKLLFVTEEDIIKLPEGKLFIHDLVGMRVCSVEGDFIGILAEVLEMPAHNVYVVRDGDKEYLIPAVDAFIVNINNKTRVIRINSIEGLLD